MQVSLNGVNLVKQFEGLKLEPYLDSAGIPTIGYGTVYYPNGDRVAMTDPKITEPDAAQYLLFALTEKTKILNDIVKVQVNQNQFDALASFCYNCGQGNLEHSTLLRELNAGNYEAAADQFLVWDKAGGVVVPGLERRRQAERALFIS